MSFRNASFSCDRNGGARALTLQFGIVHTQNVQHLTCAGLSYDPLKPVRVGLFPVASDPAMTSKIESGQRFSQGS